MNGVSAKNLRTHAFDASIELARKYDAADPLRHLREDFHIPSQKDLKSSSIQHVQDVESTYLCGNSLGLQPKCTNEFVNSHLLLWKTKGVFGHFKKFEGSKVPPWVEVDEAVTEQSAKIVGALPSETAIMQTLSANLHILMASFYRPTKDRYRIILEGKAFPSDHYVVESQLRHHNRDPSDAMVLIEPSSHHSPLLSTAQILAKIDEHAELTALLLLPGVQFYTGQFFDIKTITAHAQSKGIVVGWDLAHAVGNVPLQLHQWNVDFAAWCNYKYMNCGPGAIGGLFVHERHTQVTPTDASKSNNEHAMTVEISNTEKLEYRPRLAGWWGSTKTSRFAMTNEFVPIPGAGGFQLSNPSALDMSAVLASLSILEKTDMLALRKKSLQLTGYLEELLEIAAETLEGKSPWTIITPSNPLERGAQLSVKVDEGLLGPVMAHLEDEGVVVDERKPDVIRIAPAPLYNTFEDAWRVVEVLRDAVKKSLAGGGPMAQTNSDSVMVDGGKDSKGWSEIK